MPITGRAARTILLSVRLAFPQFFLDVRLLAMFRICCNAS